MNLNFWEWMLLCNILWVVMYTALGSFLVLFKKKFFPGWYGIHWGWRDILFLPVFFIARITLGENFERFEEDDPK